MFTIEIIGTITCVNILKDKCPKDNNPKDNNPKDNITIKYKLEK